MIKCYVRGLPKVKQNLLNIRDKIVVQAQKAINESADDVLSESRVIVPKDTTNLMNSSFVVGSNYSGRFSISNYTFSDKRKDASRLASEYDKFYSKYVRKAAKRGAKSIVAYVVYSAHYAFLVHEVPKAYKNGSWKYLQGAIQNVSYSIPQKIANSIRIVL